MNRSGVLPKKETMRLIAGLREQGCNIRRMKKGYRVEFPNGGSTMLHLTNSDSRGTLNTRAEIKRAGLIYPGDEPQIKKERNMARTLGAERTRKLDEVLARIDTEGRFFGTVEEMARAADVNGTTLTHRLKERGWTTGREGARYVWYAPGAAPATALPRLSENALRVVEWVNGEDRVIEPADVAGEESLGVTREQARLHLHNAYKMGFIDRVGIGAYRKKSEKIVQPNGKGTWPLIVTRLSDVPVKSVTPVASVTSPVTAPVTAIPAPVESKREFIDSVDSWTVAVPTDLARMAEAMGLRIEVRVWR